MLILIVAIIIIAIVAGIIFTATANKKSLTQTTDGNTRKPLPLKRKKLLSLAEQKFYHALESCIKPEHRIACKCRLEDIMYVDNVPNKQAFRNKIKSRHVDFVIFDPQNGYTLTAIELDDKSHENKKEQDEFKNDAFSDIQMKLIRIDVTNNYNIKTIENLIYNQ